MTPPKTNLKTLDELVAELKLAPNLTESSMGRTGDYVVVFHKQKTYLTLKNLEIAKDYITEKSRTHGPVEVFEVLPEFYVRSVEKEK